MDNNNQRSNQGSWRVRGAQPSHEPPAVEAPGAPELPGNAEPFHTTRIPKPFKRFSDPQPQPVVVPPQPVAVLPTLPPKPVAAPKPEPIPAPAQPEAKQPKSDTNITVNISMPKFKKPTLPNWDWKKIGKYAAIAAALIIASIVIRLVIVHIVEQRKLEKAKNRLDMVQPQTKTAPTFTPVVPKHSTVAKTASYDGTKDSYSYSDKLKGTEVIISQQPLQAGTSTEDTVAKAAKAIDASTPLTVSKGTAYLASNTKSGGQTIVLGRNNVLLFVQSPIAHSAAEWTAYLDNLSST